MKMMKMYIIVVIIFLFTAGISWGETLQGLAEGPKIATDLKAQRMKVAVELQLLQLEGQMIVDRMNKLQAEAKKLAPKIEKLKKEFRDLTDKINKM